jgi:hypothetical protein
MEAKIIFDVATKPFDWQPIIGSAALFAGGCVGLLMAKFKRRGPPVHSGAYFVMAVAILTTSYVSCHWYISRRDYLKGLSGAQYAVLEGTVDSFQPMYFEGRNEESFTISGCTFRYSDYKATVCFNQPAAHGGPIQAGMRLRVKFIDQCILRIEAFSGKPPSIPEQSSGGRVAD